MRSATVVVPFCFALLADCAKTSYSTGPALAIDPSTGKTFSSELAGTWSRTANVIGSALVLRLVARDTTISGDGTYAIEAGRSGTLTVSGALQGAIVHLDLTFDYGTQAHFDGSLTTPKLLSGAIKYGPPESMIASQLISFARK